LLRHTLLVFVLAFLPNLSMASVSAEDFLGTYEFFRYDGSSCLERPLGSSNFECQNPAYLKFVQPHTLSLELSEDRQLMDFQYSNAELGSFLQLQFPIERMKPVEQEIGLPYQGFEFDIFGETTEGEMIESDDGLFAQKVSETPFIQFRLVRFEQPRDGEVDYGVEFLRSRQTRVQLFALSRDKQGNITESRIISDNVYLNPLAVEISVQYLKP
jgi:hypothetical protein